MAMCLYSAMCAGITSHKHTARSLNPCSLCMAVETSAGRLSFKKSSQAIVPMSESVTSRWNPRWSRSHRSHRHQGDRTQFGTYIHTYKDLGLGNSAPYVYNDGYSVFYNSILLHNTT